jgi:hypothetical protein
MTEEIWKVSHVTKRGDIYEVSNKGNVKKNSKEWKCPLEEYLLELKRPVIGLFFCKKIFLSQKTQAKVFLKSSKNQSVLSLT